MFRYNMYTVFKTLAPLLLEKRRHPLLSSSLLLILQGEEEWPTPRWWWWCKTSILKVSWFLMILGLCLSLRRNRWDYWVMLIPPVMLAAFLQDRSGRGWSLWFYSSPCENNIKKLHLENVFYLYFFRLFRHDLTNYTGHVCTYLKCICHGDSW